MAGSFGYNPETIDISLAMGELSLLPAVRKAPADAIIVADGTSCRHQIHDGAGRDALHVARVLAMIWSIIPKSGNRFPACAKLWQGTSFWLDASAGEGRSEKIMLK